MKNDEINLARNLVHSPNRRRLIWRGIIFYLAVNGILLVLAAGTAVVQLRNGLQLRRQAEQVRKQFLVQHPQEGSLLSYAERLRTELIKDEKLAASINKTLPPKPRTVLPLLNLLVGRPDGSQLYRLDFTQQKKPATDLEFSICAPVEQRAAPDFLNRWRNDSRLAGQFDSITPSTTLRGKIATGDVFILSYRAAFKE